MDNNKNSFENYEKRIEEEFKNSTIFNSSDEIETPRKKKIGNNSYIKLLFALVMCVIVVTSSIFSVVKFWPANQESSTTEQQEALIYLTNSANVSLKNMKNAPKNAISNVSKIVIKNETDKFTCVPYKEKSTDSDGVTTETIKYKLLDVDPTIPIDNAVVTSFYDNLFNVTAVSKLEDKWSLADCGLENPKILVEVTMADDSSFEFRVGDKVATGDGYYYVSTSLSDGIYIAEGDVYDNFSSNFYNLVDLTVFEALQEDDSNSEYFSNGKLTIFDSINLNGEKFNNTALSYHNSDDEVMSYFISKPFKAYADEEKIATVFSPISEGLIASLVYKTNPNDKDFEKYGLKNPYLEVEYKVDNKTYNLKFSKPGVIDSNYCACIVNDVPVVYGVLVDSIKFIDWTQDDLRYNLLYLKNIETFKSFKVSYGGKSYEYDLSWDKVVDKENSDETSEATENVLSVVLNSTPINDDNFKTAYQRLTLISANKYLNKDIELSVNPDIKFEIELDNGSTDVITFTKYNENYYLHKLNGIGDELISARTVDLLIQNYEKLRKGEKVDSPNNQQ